MQNDQNKQNQDSQDVLAKIRSDEVRMKPRGYFVAKGVALIVVAVLVLILSAFLLSYILFSLRTSGDFFLLDYGSSGWYVFLSLFPWFALIVDIILLVVLEWLLRQFRFGYRVPLVYLGLGTLFLTLFFSLAIDATPFHSSLMRDADEQRLPVIGGMYDGLRPSPSDHDVFRGVVTSTDGHTLIVQAETATGTSGVSWTVIPLNPAMTGTIKVGDEIFIAGSSTLDSNALNVTNSSGSSSAALHGIEIHAFGISKLN